MPHNDGSLLPFLCAAPNTCPQGHVYLFIHLELVMNVHFSLLLLNAYSCRPGTMFLSLFTANFFLPK